MKSFPDAINNAVDELFFVLSHHEIPCRHIWPTKAGLGYSAVYRREAITKPTRRHSTYGDYIPADHEVEQRE